MEAGVNVHDTRMLALTLESRAVERPHNGIQHLCLDKGYDNPTGHRAVAINECQRHIERMEEEKLDWGGVKRFPDRWWVVEWTLAWISKCRAISVRYDMDVSK